MKKFQQSPEKTKKQSHPGEKGRETKAEGGAAQDPGHLAQQSFPQPT